MKPPLFDRSWAILLGMLLTLPLIGVVFGFSGFLTVWVADTCLRWAGLLR